MTNVRMSVKEIESAIAYQKALEARCTEQDRYNEIQKELDFLKEALAIEKAKA